MIRLLIVAGLITVVCLFARWALEIVRDMRNDDFNDIWKP